MKFLANENFPLPSVVFLRQHGFEVRSVAEKYAGYTDEEVLNIAVKDGLIVLTFDRDYGELLFRYRMLSVIGVVYFRDKGNSPEYAGNILYELILKGLIIENHFTVIDTGGVRQRKLR